jgi:hypothetical protein
VVVEADGTYVAAQREQGDRFEVKTGVSYTGKQRAGGRRHRRFRLPHAPHQIDHFHIAQRLWQVSGADAKVFEDLKALAFPIPWLVRAGSEDPA